MATETDSPTVTTLVPVRQTQHLEPVHPAERVAVQFSDDTVAQTYKQARSQAVARNGKTNAIDARLDPDGERTWLSGGPLNWALAYVPFTYANNTNNTPEA